MGTVRLIAALAVLTLPQAGSAQDTYSSGQLPSTGSNEALRCARERVLNYDKEPPPSCPPGVSERPGSARQPQPTSGTQGPPRNRRPPPGLIQWNELDGLAEGSAEMEEWCKWYFRVARAIQSEYQLKLAAARSDPSYRSMMVREGSVKVTYQIGPTPSRGNSSISIHTITPVAVPQTPLGRVVGDTLRVVAGRPDILAFPPNPPRTEPVIRTSVFRYGTQGGPPEYDLRCRAWIAQQNS